MHILTNYVDPSVLVTPPPLTSIGSTARTCLFAFLHADEAVTMRTAILSAILLPVRSLRNIFMALWTVSLGTLSANALTTNEILKRGYSLKMIGANTGSVLAEMIPYQPSRGLACKEVVSAHHFLATKVSVAVAILAGSPKPARFCLVNFGPESLLGRNLHTCIS